MGRGNRTLNNYLSRINELRNIKNPQAELVSDCDGETSVDQNFSASTPDKFYHVAPASVRDSIFKYGLDNRLCEEELPEKSLVANTTFH